MPSYSEIVIGASEKAGDSVVNISIVRMAQDSFFNTVPLQGMGSGIIMDEGNGTILTNNHIVAGAQRVAVTLNSGKRFSGTIVGADRVTDIAVVRVEPDGLKSAELGDSDKLRVGQLVIAIGNPFGFLLGGPTVTTGVISALNRHIRAEDRVFENLIQTDAPINPGNSGGALLDEDAKVIGVNTAMIPFAQGIGFAIPINVAKQAAEDLVTYGKIARPWIGIVGVSITEEIARYYNLPPKGILVMRIASYGPADQAGIIVGDVIADIDDIAIDDMEDLQRAMRQKRVGDRIEVIILRGRQRIQIQIILGEAE
ncbi:trypsin-like peptidase domain-containing protein [Candidatus Bathyarchaeota archaeon]|nr:trypsin-like peptidase domain-containing protein [Candidatus Bathyarchaeota archaeon]